MWFWWSWRWFWWSWRWFYSFLYYSFFYYSFFYYRFVSFNRSSSLPPLDKVDPINNFKRLVLAHFHSYSVGTMPKSCLLK